MKSFLEMNCSKTLKTGKATKNHQTLTSLSLSQKNCEYEQDWIYKPKAIKYCKNCF